MQGSSAPAMEPTAESKRLVSTALKCAAGWGLAIVPLIMSLNGLFWNGTDYNPNFGATVCMIVIVFAGFAATSALAIAAAEFGLLPSGLARLHDNWLIRGTLGGGVGWMLGWLGAGLTVTNLTLYGEPLAWTFGGIVTGLAVGLFMGVAQWTALRRRLFRPGWIGVNVLAWASALAVYWLVYWLAGGSFHAVATSYYDNGPWVKTVEAPGSWLGMLLGWAGGGLVLGAILTSAMRRFIRADAAE